MSKPGYRFALFATVLAVVVVLLGAYTRLTHAGLGCPDWPGCYGFIGVPMSEHKQTLAEARFPEAPVEVAKGWYEMIHRYFAGALGLVILGLAVQALRRRGEVDQPLKLPLFLLGLVTLQAAFGMWTVTLKLWPQVVTAHLLGGFATLSLLFLLTLRLSGKAAALANLPARLRSLAALGLLLVVGQIALGGWVSSNYAVLACDTYPLCQNSWWPDMNLSKAFELWRPLGQDASGQALPFQALTAIHMVHRWHAVVPALLILWVARSWMTMGLRRQGWLLIGVLFLQFVTGISNAVLGWPMLAALMHTGSAAVLLVLLTWVLASTQPRKAERIAATFDRNML